MAENTQSPIGFVTAMTGTVTATGADGAERTLSVGDPVFADELIRTADAASVAVSFIDGTRLDLGRSSQAMLDTDVFDPSTVTEGADVQAMVAAMQQAILEGEDPTTAFEAAAAGQQAPGTEGGHTTVRVPLTGEQVTPDSGFGSGPEGLGFGPYPETEGADRPTLAGAEETPPVVPPEGGGEEEPPVVPPGGEEEPPVVPPGNGEEPGNGGNGDEPGNGGNGEQPDVVVSSISLLTNTNVNDQVLEISIIDGDGNQQVIGWSDTVVRDEQGSQFTSLNLGDGGVGLDYDHNYAVAVRFQTDPSNPDHPDHVDLRAFSLGDGEGGTLYDLLSHPTGADDVKVGLAKNDFDGVIFTLEGNGSGFDLGEPIGFNIDGGQLTLDSSSAGKNAFDFDLGMLALTDTEPDVLSDITEVNITGGSNEDNTVTLRAEDVLDLSGTADLTITGDDGDSVTLLNGDGGTSWTQQADDGGFSVYTAELDLGTTVTVRVESDVNTEIV